VERDNEEAELLRSLKGIRASRVMHKQRAREMQHEQSETVGFPTIGQRGMQQILYEGEGADAIAPPNE
jgi:hypothetical protein